MITEKGTVLVATPIDEGVYKDMNHNAVVSSVFLLVLGVLILLMGIFVSESIAMIIAGVVAAFFAIVLLSTLGKNRKDAAKTPRVNSYEFFRDCFAAVQRINGEIVDVELIYNHTILRARETKELLLLYKTTNTCYPIRKSQLSGVEADTLRALFRLPVKSYQPIISLPAANVHLSMYTAEFASHDRPAEEKEAEEEKPKA